MENCKIDGFNIIGISVRTDNNNGNGSRDIGELWNRFMSEKVLEQIPNKIDNTIYSIYTDYEGDYTKPYTTIIGCKVHDLSTVPDGFIGRGFGGGNYKKVVATGNLLEGVIFSKWQDIWNLDLPRLYTHDFEVYGEKAQNPTNAEVDIFIAVK